jgi:hypothetical protein
MKSCVMGVHTVENLYKVLNSAQVAMSVVCMTFVAGVAVICSLATLGAVAGLLPWFTLGVATYGDATISNAGIVLQTFVTLLSVALCFWLPSNRRILVLTNSHRQFNVTMKDVATAYYQAHLADRTGLFTLTSEFDAVHERYLYLKRELGDMKSDILMLAAQMSYETRDLASVYSDDKVARARAFLAERSAELEQMETLIEKVTGINAEIEPTARRLSFDEQAARSKLSRLVEALKESLGQLGYEINPHNVVRLPGE